jgi:hypothetical protein
VAAAVGAQPSVWGGGVVRGGERLVLMLVLVRSIAFAPFAQNQH